MTSNSSSRPGMVLHCISCDETLVEGIDAIWIDSCSDPWCSECYEEYGPGATSYSDSDIEMTFDFDDDETKEMDA